MTLFENDTRKRLILQNLLLALLPVMVFMAAVGGILFGWILPLFQEDYLKLKYATVRNVMQIQMTQLHELHDKVQNGEVSDSLAQDWAKKTLERLRYGDDSTDYFWVIGPDARLWVHGMIPRYLYGDPDTMPSPDGKPLGAMLRTMQQIAKDSVTGGSYRYLWLHHENQTSEKLSYLREFKPWGWVLGTGVYLDDVHAEFSRIRRVLIAMGFVLTFLCITVSVVLSLRAFSLQKLGLQFLTEARIQEQRFRTLLETIPVGAVLVDGAHRIQDANQALCTLTGSRVQEMQGKFIDEACHLGRELEKSQEQTVRELIHVDGRVHCVMLSSKPIPLPQQEPPLFLWILLDITSQRELAHSNQELQGEIAERSSNLARLDGVVRARQSELDRLGKQLNIVGRVFEAASDAVMVTNVNGIILSVNPAFTLITGYSADEVLGENPRLLKSGRHNPEFYQNMWESVLLNGHFSGEIWNRRKSGEAFPCHIDITAIKDLNGNVTEFIAITKDLTDLQRSRDQLAHLHDYDPLTGLPNRQAFVSSLYAACMQARQSEGHLAVAILGVDRFSRINKTAGYLVGDQVLQGVGHRLREALPESFQLGRFAGDEFACAIPYRHKSWEALQLLERLKSSLIEPFEIDDGSVSVTACVGVALYPDDTTDPEALTRLASISLDRAKQENPNTLRPFTDDLHQALGHRIALESEIRRGIESNEFQMYFQPKVNVVTGKCLAAESLIRWFRADGTMTPPDQFIGVAEEIGEIDRLGMIALRQSCRMTRQLNTSGVPMRIAVNVSPKQLFTSNFALQVLRVLEVEQVDPTWLELEITEGAVMEDLDRATRIMGDLVVEGLQFTLDDFGTGYSSLSHIRTLPIGGFKIDRSFVLDLAENRETQAICSLFMKLAKDLRLELTVEGVETAEQIAFLKSFPDAMIQGYFYSRPLPASDFMSYLSKLQG